MRQPWIQIRRWQAEEIGYDMLLRFTPAIDADYEVRHGAARQWHITRMIVFGLVLYNIYNLTAYVLVSDIFAMTVFARIGLVTPFSIALIFLVHHVGPLWRERWLTAGLINAYLVPLGMFWWSQSERALLTFNELTLVIVFATTLITLRFRYACIYICAVFSATLLAILSKAGLPPALEFSFAVQMFTCCIFCLFANHHREMQRCQDYMQAYRANGRAHSAETSERRMTELSLTDPLTGIPNRRSFEATMTDLADRDTALALMMIDIDHFKLYNDSLGHPAGDACLQRVAAKLSVIADGADMMVARIGGEEFAIVAQSLSPQGAAALAARIVREVREMNDPHPGRLDGVAMVTISLGLALTIETGNRDRSWLMSQADAALYRAKRAGRDGWQIAGDGPKSRLQIA